MARARTVAVLMNLVRIYDRQVVHGIARYVRTGVDWQVHFKEDPSDEIVSLSRWSANGVIVDLDDVRLVRAAQGLRVPVVGIGHLAASSKELRIMSTVRTDDEMIGQWGADHLMELGLQHFAYCAIPRRGLDIWTQARHEAFRQRLAERGFSCFRFSAKHHATSHWPRMLAELVSWLRNMPLPMGILACNDACAHRLLEACQELRLRVPDDVAVLGVDNDEVTCEMATPTLSSIVQATEQMGYRAAELLDELMTRSRGKPKHLVVPPLCLEKRQSTELFTAEDAVVARALRFIRARSADAVGAAEVARHVGVSRSTLAARFKASLGRSVHACIQRVRLQTARRLLLTTDLPLHEVARRCGYRTMHYLCHVFRRELRQTPGQVRARHGAEEPGRAVRTESQRFCDK